MLRLTAAVSQDNNFLAFGKARKLTVNLAVRDDDVTLPRISVAKFLDSLLSHAPEVVPLSEAEFYQEDGRTLCLIEDKRGRPKESFQLSDPSYKQREEEEREEELFSSDGVILEPPANLEDYPPQVAALNEIPFSYRVTTRFHRFTNRGHIIHQIIPSGSAAIREIVPQLSLKTIARLFPARLNRVRLGYESYERRFWGSMLGLIPRINSRFYLEVTASRIFLFAEAQGKQNKGLLPFEETGLISAIEQTLEENNLYHGFVSELRKKSQQVA